jgi:membrane-associated phospholipid phosphatase
MEERILLFFHEHSAPWLDSAFLFSHELGTGIFGFVLVGLAAAFAAYRRQRHEAILWIVLGLSTYFLQLGIKQLVFRPRPALWSTLVVLTTPAFPSGHALSAATFYPLLARTLSREWPRTRTLAWAAALAMAAYIGLGRLYLGVHWPSDVLGGWAIGGLQTLVGVRVVARLHAARERAAQGQMQSVAPLADTTMQE